MKCAVVIQRMVPRLMGYFWGPVRRHSAVVVMSTGTWPSTITCMTVLACGHTHVINTASEPQPPQVSQLKSGRFRIASEKTLAGQHVRCTRTWLRSAEEGAPPPFHVAA